MTRSIVFEIVLTTFLDWFEEISNGSLGAESEFVIVEKDIFEMPNLERIQLIFKWLIHNGWLPVSEDKLGGSFLAGAQNNGMKIVLEVGMVTEVNFAPSESIHVLVHGRNHVIQLLKKVCNLFGMKLLSLGVHPNTIPSKHSWNPKIRAEIFKTIFSDVVHFNTLSASEQVHIATSRDRVIDLVNVGNYLSAIFTALGANASVHCGQATEIQALRQWYWYQIDHTRTGIPKWFESLEDYISYIINQKLIIAEVDGKYVSPQMPFWEFAAQRKLTGESFLKALQLHIGTLWFNCRATPYGTAEFRVACQFPEINTNPVLAIAVGANEKLTQMINFIRSYDLKMWEMIAIQSIFKGLDANVYGVGIQDLCEKTLIIATRGLERRKLGEERHLEMYYKILESGLTHADRAAEILSNGGMESLVNKYSF